MNFKLSSLFLFMGMFLFFACSKEKIDKADIDEPDVDHIMSICNVNFDLRNESGILMVDSITGATPPYIYIWSTGETTNVIEVTTDGVYSVTVIDIDSCNVSKSINVTNFCEIFSAKIRVEFDATGASFTAKPKNGTPPYNYKWSTGETTQTIHKTKGGIFEVTVTDENSCIASDTVDLRGVLCNDFGGSINVDSSGFEYILRVNVLGGTPPFSYKWSTGETVSSLVINGPGTYEVVVMDANVCVFKEAFTIVDPCPSFDLRVAGLPPGGGKLYPVLEGGIPPYSYQWSTGETTDTIVVMVDGEYTVTATDVSGCEATGGIIHVNGDPCTDFVVHSRADPFAKTLSVTPLGGNPPYAVLWSTGETTHEITFIDGEYYFVTIEDTKGCYRRISYR